MFKKWAGWKKVAACLMGAALLMQGGSVAMGATETAKYLSLIHISEPTRP